MERIEVSFSKETLDALNAIYNGTYGGELRTDSHAPSAAVTAARDDMEDDIFPEYTHEESRQMSDEDVELAVTAARERGVKPQAIRKMMRDLFGIKSVWECPDRRRMELIDELYKLTA